MFGDDTLNQLIRTALDRNFDVRIAAERVQQARAQLGITRADQFPFVDVQANSARFASPRGVRFVSFPSAPILARASRKLGAALSWEVDLWGRLRRLTEAARARYLASEEGRHAVNVALVADVTSAYFQLLEYRAGTRDQPQRRESPPMKVFGSFSFDASKARHPDWMFGRPNS